MQAQAQTQPQKKEGVQYSPTTLFLCVDDEHEYKIAKHYLAKHYPGSPASVFREIPIDRMQSEHTIIPLYRTVGCTAAVATEIINGQERARNADFKALADEVFEARPLPIKDCWTVLSTAGDGIAFASVSGTVQVPKLCSEISARMQDPIAIKPSGLRIRHLKIGP